MATPQKEKYFCYRHRNKMEELANVMKTFVLQQQQQRREQQKISSEILEQQFLQQ